MVVSTAKHAMSHHMNAAHLTSTQEEADTIMILHALDASRSGYTVHILSPDTDLFVLGLSNLLQLGKDTCILVGQGDKQRLVPLKPIHDVLGNEKAKALLGFHAFTGCDTTGRFAGKGKRTCWKAFNKSSQQVIQAFCELGAGTVPSAETVKSLEKFVCHMYSPKAEFDDIGKLRWQLFKQSQAEAEKMPPTKDVLKYHILRAHYQAMVWSQAAIPQPTLPQPTMFGWKAEGEVFVPIITAQKVAPDTVIEPVAVGLADAK